MSLLTKWLNADKWSPIRDKFNAAIDTINALSGGTTGQVLKKSSGTDFAYGFADQYPSQTGKKGKALISNGTAGGESWGSPVFMDAAVNITLSNNTSYTTGTLTSPDDVARNNKLTISMTVFATSDRSFTLSLYKNGSVFKTIHFANIDTSTDTDLFATVISYSFSDLSAAANAEYFVLVTVGTASDFIESTFILESIAI